MELSSPRFKALTVSAGFTFWFVIIISALGYFSFEVIAIFALIVFPVMQLFAMKVSKALDIFAIYNTKFFLGILFVTVISIYGILFKFLRIDLLRLKEKKDTYWLPIEKGNSSRIFKEY